MYSQTPRSTFLHFYIYMTTCNKATLKYTLIFVGYTHTVARYIKMCIGAKFYSSSVSILM